MPSAMEDLNRLNRAIPIVFALIASGINSRMACTSDPGTKEKSGKDSPDWKLAAELADVRDYVPGSETQKLIIKLLTQFDEMRKRFPPVAIRWPNAASPLDYGGPAADYLKWSAQEALKR